MSAASRALYARPTSVHWVNGDNSCRIYHSGCRRGSRNHHFVNSHGDKIQKARVGSAVRIRIGERHLRAVSLAAIGQRNARTSVVDSCIVLFQLPPSTKQFTSIEVLREESANEFRSKDVFLFVIPCQIEFFSGGSYVAAVLQISKHPIGHMVILLGVGPLFNCFGEILQVAGCLSKFNFPHGLSLLNVTSVIPCCISGRSLRRHGHALQGMLLEAIAGAILILRCFDKRHAIVWPRVRIVPKDSSESRSRA